MIGDEPDSDFAAPDEALEKPANFNARKARAVELRFFGGLSVEDTAEALQVSNITARREWYVSK